MNKFLINSIAKLIGLSLNIQSVFNKQGAAKRAFNIFVTPRGGRLTPEQKAYLFPQKDNLLKVDDLQIQTYRWKGKGPTVLLAHGWESNAHRWWKLIHDLQKKDFNIIALDAPGHGASDGKHLNVILYAKILKEVIAFYKPDYQIGHSVGALASLYCNHKYDTLEIKKLVLLGTANELSEVIEGYKKTLGLNKRVINAMENLAYKTFNIRIKDFSGTQFAKSLTIPGLIIHDVDDKITPVHCSKNIHEVWHNSTYIETKGLGHSLYQAKVRSHIISFLNA